MDRLSSGPETRFIIDSNDSNSETNISKSAFSLTSFSKNLEMACSAKNFFGKGRFLIRSVIQQHVALQLLPDFVENFITKDFGGKKNAGLNPHLLKKNYPASSSSAFLASRTPIKESISANSPVTLARSTCFSTRATVP
jgi:hypothetical protein